MMFSRGAYGIGRCFAGGYFGPWHMLIAAGFVIGVAALIIMLVQKKRNNGNDDDLLAMLKERYVRGEITEEEYTTKKNALTRR
jgi:putative membrane protein